MPRLKTSMLVPGMVTAEDVFNYNNQLILPKGLELTNKSITKLEFYSILYVHVEDYEEYGEQAKSEIDKVIEQDNLSYSEKVKSSESYKKFRKNFVQEVDQIKGSINDVVEKILLSTRTLFYRKLTSLPLWMQLPRPTVFLICFTTCVNLMMLPTYTV